MSDNWWEGKVKEVDPAGAQARNVPDVGLGESAIRGFANAATFGLAPRISAGVNAGLGKIAPDMFGSETYSQRLKDYLDADKAAQEANPKTSFAASAVPNLIQAAATGGGATGVGAGANALRQVGSNLAQKVFGGPGAGLVRQGITNAGMGAVNAAGNAREGEGVSDALTGGATGAALSVLPAGLGKATDLLARKFTSSVAAGPLESLLQNKPKGWQDEIAKIMGDTKQSLNNQFGSIEQAGIQFLDTIRNTGKMDRGFVQMSDLPAVKGLIDRTTPTMKQVAKEAGKATVSGGVGAAGGAGLNYALGSPVDPTQAALAGAGLNAFRNAQSFAGQAGKKGLMSIARSDVPERIFEFGSKFNKPLGAVNQLGTQAVAAETTNSGGFRKLSDYLSGQSEEDKRKQAMQLSASPEGRSFSNDETPVDNWWEGKVK